MARTELVMLDEDHARLEGVLGELCAEANATFGLLLSSAGQQIAMVGELPDGDATTMASLAAGNVATTEGLAALIGESEFSALFHEGRRNSMHLTLVGGRLILLLVFGELSSLGLVRLRVDQHAPRLRDILIEAEGRAADPATTPVVDPLGQITDEDIESLFN